MRDTRDVGAAPPHDADSMAAMRSVETDRHMMVKVRVTVDNGQHDAASNVVRVILPAVIGALIGGGAVAYLHRNDVTSAAGSRAASSADAGGARDDLDALRADVARLKTNAPSQSHTMSDVGYHWTNLWFAAEKKNWPLAKFYFEESRAHILWTIQLRPVRKGPDGNDVNLVPIFEGIDTSAFKAVADAIQARIQPRSLRRTA